MILDGPPAAVAILEPRRHQVGTTSHRRQITPPNRVTSPSALRTFYEEKMAQWNAALGRKRPLPQFDIATIGAWAEFYMERHRSLWRASTYQTMRRWWSILFAVLPRTTLLAEINRPVIEEVINALVIKELTPLSIRSVVGLLVRALSLAADESYISEHPGRKIKLPSVIRTHRRTISQAEVSSLLEMAAAMSLDLHLVVSLAVLAGLRRSEALAVRWADVDLTGRLLHIASDSDFTTKSGRDRFVPINERLSDILRSSTEQTMPPDAFIVCPDRHPTSRGIRWDFRASWQSLLHAIGLPSLPFHTTRRTFATIAVESGVPLTKVKMWLGHSSVTVTDVYVQHSPVYDQDVERVLAAPSPPAPATMAGPSVQ